MHLTSDPQVPFVPEDSTEASQYDIPCRTTDPQSAVILRRIPSEEEVPSHYEQKYGFVGFFSPGKYVCETVVNGEAVQSMVYTVTDMPGKSEHMFKLGNKS